MLDREKVAESLKKVDDSISDLWQVSSLHVFAPPVG